MKKALFLLFNNPAHSRDIASSICSIRAEDMSHNPSWFLLLEGQVMNSKWVIEMNFEVGGIARVAHSAVQFLVKLCSFYGALAYKLGYCSRIIFIFSPNSLSQMKKVEMIWGQKKGLICAMEMASHVQRMKIFQPSIPSSSSSPGRGHRPSQMCCKCVCLS